MNRSYGIFAGIALLALLPGCGGGSDTNAPPAGGSIAANGGGGQVATVLSTLSPYSVLVKDSMGQPIAGVAVDWRVASGGGSVVPAGTTDGAGIALATATLSNVAGPQTITAAITGYTGSPVGFVSTGTAGPAARLTKTGGDLQSAPASTTLPLPLRVRVTDQYGNGVGGVTVQWAVTAGSGTIAASSSVSDNSGEASMTHTLGAIRGPDTVTATLPVGPPIKFSSSIQQVISILAGGNNIPERFGSDLWVAGGYAYTGTWGFRGTVAGNAVKVWQLGATGAPTLVDSIITPNIATVSDIEVSPDSQWLVFSTEGGANNGVWVYTLANPAAPALAASYLVPSGVHTVSLSVIGGTLYAFGAEDPGSPSLLILNLSQAGSGTITLASQTPIAPNYGIHDTYVRNGLAFVCAWNTGLMIYDVGDGRKGGSPTSPQLISSVVTAGGEVHNAWWFNNPVTGQARYVFIGQEGPGAIGASSSGDIHVVDVSNLDAPVEVAFYHMSGTAQSAGPHNFWMDESGQVLYSAYYNGGVLALDVSGTLSGNLSNREVARIQPGGAGNTYVWGVHLYNGSLYALDMVSGFWQLTPLH